MLKRINNNNTPNKAHKKIENNNKNTSNKNQQSKKRITGKIRISKSGNGFIDLPNGESIIIPRGRGKDAIDRDTVKVELLPPRNGKTGLAGSVVEVLKRGTTHISGVVDCEGKKFFLRPIKKQFPFLINLVPGRLGLSTCNTAALAKINSWTPDKDGNLTGEIIKTYGTRGDHEADMELILGESLENPNFEKELLKAVDNLPTLDEDLAIKDGRRDFRGVTTCTIDPDTAKDFDDALSIKELPNDEYEIGIHIADVSHYVTPNSPIDIEAYRRGTSIYLVDRCIPMLPERLSNDLCSLKEAVPRLTMSTVVTMRADGSVKDSWIGPGIINSDKRFNYGEVDVILENKSGLLYKELNTLMNLAERMEKSRVARGALVFNRDEVRFVLDKAGKPIDIIREKSSPSHLLIESFMLLANNLTANYLSKRNGGLGKKEGMYRVHGEPNDTAIMELVLFVKGLGIKTPANLKKPIDILKHIMKSVAHLPIAPIVDDMVIRSQAKAHYSEINSGHFGLALKSYTHFTSPIRRYPDLVAHRIIRDMLIDKKITYTSKELHDTAEHASEREERATEAERASIRYKQIEFLEDKTNTIRIGVVVGITDSFQKVIDTETGAMVSCTPNKIKVTLGDSVNYKLLVADRLQETLTGEVESK